MTKLDTPARLLPVIIARDAVVVQALAQLIELYCRVGRVARTLQPYTVPVPPGDRNRLICQGHVRFHGQWMPEGSEGKLQQFAVLANADLYHRETGLGLEHG